MRPPRLTYCDLGGWAGTALLLAGYLLLATGLIAPSGWYFGANVVGGVGLVAAAWEKRAWPLVVLNVAYGAISLVGLVRALLP